MQAMASIDVGAYVIGLTKARREAVVRAIQTTCEIDGIVAIQRVIDATKPPPVDRGTERHGSLKMRGHLREASTAMLLAVRRCWTRPVLAPSNLQSICWLCATEAPITYRAKWPQSRSPPLPPAKREAPTATADAHTTLPVRMTQSRR